MTTSEIVDGASKISRRTAITRAAGIGAVAAFATVGMNAGADAAGRRAIAQPGANMTDATPAAGGTPTIVFVHGAFADSSGWLDVIGSLQAEGHTTLAVANPLRGVASDSAYVASVLAGIPGPVLLVGHSYGGAVITNAASLATNVIGLVYVTAFMLDEGEAGFDILGQFPPTLLASALRPANADPENPDLLIDPAAYPSVFASDVPETVTVRLAATQRPVLGSTFAEKSGPAAWKTLPSWAAIASTDNVIGTEATRFMAERAGATIVEFDASHAVLISQPEAIADLIRTALVALS